MNTKKRVLGLTLCLGLLFSMSAIQNNVSAEIGWGINNYFENEEPTSNVVSAVTTVSGALAGAEIGASIGSLGGPVGAIVGAGLGAL